MSVPPRRRRRRSKDKAPPAPPAPLRSPAIDIVTEEAILQSLFESLSGDGTTGRIDAEAVLELVRTRFGERMNPSEALATVEAIRACGGEPESSTGETIPGFGFQSFQQWWRTGEVCGSTEALTRLCF